MDGSYTLYRTAVENVDGEDTEVEVALEIEYTVEIIDRQPDVGIFQEYAELDKVVCKAHPGIEFTMKELEEIADHANSEIYG